MLYHIERIINKQVRPQIITHGGDINLLSFDEGIVKIKLLGQCSSCPASYLTVKHLVLAELQKAIPEIIDVVVECSISDDLLAQARKLMGRSHG